MKKEKEKRELRSPDGTEAESDVGEVREAVAALRRAAVVVGVAGPVAAAQQTIRASGGPCGVSHASG